jgi:hypothetical protein
MVQLRRGGRYPSASTPVCAFGAIQSKAQLEDWFLVVALAKKIFERKFHGSEGVPLFLLKAFAKGDKIDLPAAERN